MVKLNWHNADRSVLAWLARRYSRSMFVNFRILEQGMLKEMCIGWELRSEIWSINPVIHVCRTYMSRTFFVNSYAIFFFTKHFSMRVWSILKFGALYKYWYYKKFAYIMLNILRNFYFKMPLSRLSVDFILYTRPNKTTSIRDCNWVAFNYTLRHSEKNFISLRAFLRRVRA